MRKNLIKGSSSPIFLKAVVALGYDPMWFGVIITIQIEVAAMTPPLGFNLFVLRRVVPDGDFRDIVAYAEQKGDHEDHGSRC